MKAGRGWKRPSMILFPCPAGANSSPSRTPATAVPELTRSPDIQLNKRLSLRRRLEMLSQPQIVGRPSPLGVFEADG
jgi:hypothetical protein